MRDISFIRGKALTLDTTVQETQALHTVRQKFNTNIKAKQKEIDSLAGVITRNRQLASDEIEKVLKESRAEAKQLISEAESAKGEAETILAKNKKNQTRLDVISQELDKREADLAKKEDHIEQHLAMIAKEKEVTQENLLISQTRYQEAVEAYIGAVSLLSLAVDQMENLAKIRQEVSEEIYQTLARTDIMYQRVVKLTKLVDVDKLLLKEKAIELQDKERLLSDRRRQLDRVATELKQNGKRSI